MRIRLMLIVIFLSIAFNSVAADDGRGAIPRFEIKNYQVEGNTVIAGDELKSILAPFTGKEKDFGTVQEAHEALEHAYRSRGFYMVVVTLPEQEMKTGVVRLKVTENRIGKINIEGNRFFDEKNIRASLPELRQGEIPNLDAVSLSLKLANGNPAKKVNLQLLKSDREREVDAKIEVKDEKPWKIGISADNTGDQQTGTARLGILLQHANVFNRDHLLTLQYITSPEKIDKVSIYSIGYRVPLYSLGSSIDLIGAYSNVDSGTISAASYDMNVSGKGSILGIRYNQNLTRIGNYEHKLIMGLDYRAYENNVDFLGSQLGNNVTVHPVSLTYAGTLTTDSRITAGFYLTNVQNLPGIWDNRDTGSDFENARAGAPRSYNIFRYGANLSYVTGGDWKVHALVNGQYTNDPLVPGEQFGLGGANSVRGFREREIANDRGYSGSAEIYTPDLSRLFGIKAFQSRALVFYDTGYVSRKDPLPGDTASTEIASVGPGLRITDGKRFSVAADYGLVVNPPDQNTSKWSGRWHLSASVLF
jgi:hemolysin activation/secretion protein